MNWLMVSFIAPFIWSLLNHSDKYLLSRYSKNVGVGGYAVLTFLFSVLALPFIYLVSGGGIIIDYFDILTLFFSGIFVAAGILLYLFALDLDDASHVVPFWFLVPIFSYILGVIFLNEIIDSYKVIGALITLFGAFILSLEFDQGFRVKKSVILLMTSSSLLMAISNIFFKETSQNYSFSQLIFWNQLGLFIFGLVLFLFIKKYRKEFFKAITLNDVPYTLLNFGGEVFHIIAEFVAYYSILLAPVSLVLLISYTFQPLFVFIEGLLITTLFPHLISEKISHKHIIQKVLAILIMTLGVYEIML